MNDQRPGQVHGSLSVPTTSIGLEYINPDLTLQDSDLPFPLYVVGPATEKAVAKIIASSLGHPNSPFTALNPQIYGSHSGSGAVLAPFILHHYNTLHYHRLFTFWEAPRLPFIPLTGPGPSPSKTAGGEVRRGGMVRLERNDVRLQKMKLLFLVGETRRDVIPKTLMDDGLGEGRVEVEEAEVYRTEERGGVRVDIERVTQQKSKEHEKGKVIVVAVFSPQGCQSMLRGIGFLDERGQILEGAKRRWDGDEFGRHRIVVATIGPTTRDFLRDRFGFEPDVVAEKPSPDGIGKGITDFLKGKNIIT
jgi:uroporphyrinogen-III synthase